MDLSAPLHLSSLWSYSLLFFLSTFLLWRAHEPRAIATQAPRHQNRMWYHTCTQTRANLGVELRCIPSCGLLLFFLLWLSPPWILKASLCAQNTHGSGMVRAFPSSTSLLSSMAGGTLAEARADETIETPVPGLRQGCQEWDRHPSGSQSRH